jgi:hypothetical protein
MHNGVRAGRSAVPMFAGLVQAAEPGKCQLSEKILVVRRHHPFGQVKALDGAVVEILENQLALPSLARRTIKKTRPNNAGPSKLFRR